MRVEQITLGQFRNIASLSLKPGPGANIIYADNAQGKTNLLEAIWLFCGAKSFRGAKDSEFIRFNQELAELDLRFFAQERSQTATIRFGQGKKQALVNEIKLSRVGELAEHFCCVIFSPDHLWIVKRGPEQRRQLLDTGLSQIYPKYQKALESYERIVRQRSVLLRDARRHTQLLDTLDVWDNHLAEYGAYLTTMRDRYVERLSAEAESIYQGMAGEKERLSLTYRPSFLPVEETVPKDRQQCKERLLKELQGRRQEEFQQGVTIVGPHRDELDIQVDGRAARAFASQGQQRSCVLAIKLAECRLLTTAVGESPVILLDDVMSELDEGRREYLLNHLKDRQVFITCCDTGAFKGLEDGKVFQLKEGSLVTS